MVQAGESSVIVEYKEREVGSKYLCARVEEKRGFPPKLFLVIAGDLFLEICHYEGKLDK